MFGQILSSTPRNSQTRLGGLGFHCSTLWSLYLSLTIGANAWAAGTSSEPESASTCVAILVVPGYQEELSLEAGKAVPAMLESLGALRCVPQVVERFTSEAELRAALKDARAAVPRASTVILFYMGHSFLRSGRLQLLPSSAVSRRDERALVPADALVEAIQDDDELSTMVVFDSCLSPIDDAPLVVLLGLLPSADTKILLSAYPGQNADDRMAFSSYFAAALADPSSQGQDIRVAFNRASDAFREARALAHGEGVLPDQMPYSLTSWSPALYVDQVGGGLSRTPVGSAPAVAPPPAVAAAPAPVGETAGSGSASIASDDSWAIYYRACELVGGRAICPTPNQLIGRIDRSSGQSPLLDACERDIPDTDASPAAFAGWVLTCAARLDRTSTAVVDSGYDESELSNKLLARAASALNAPDDLSLGRLDYGRFSEETMFSGIFAYSNGWCSVYIERNDFSYRGRAVCHDRIEEALP